MTTHRFTMRAAYDLPLSEVKPYSVMGDWRPTDHNVLIMFGPICHVCEMTPDELMYEGKIRECPGPIPDELRRLRSTGDSMFAGMSREQRRKSQHTRRRQERKAVS